MPRRGYSNAEVYDGETLVASSARVIDDTGRSRVEVKVRGQETVVYEVVSGVSIRKEGRDRIHTWDLVAGGTLTAITVGCNCGR